MAYINKFYGIIILVICCIVFITIFELIAYFSLPENERKPILYNKEFNTYPAGGFESLQAIEFDIIDPLLGWRMSDSILCKKGFKTEFGNIVFHGNCNCADTLVIYLSGGSTTDPAVIPQNWPTLLTKLFDSAGICAKIIIGAVGGYNSGQELLKLLSTDLRNFIPDIHLSYSGANEIEPRFISIFEQDFYINCNKPVPPRYVPNLWIALQHLFYLKDAREHAKINDYYKEIRDNYYNKNYNSNYAEQVFRFWAANMNTMQALAEHYGYRFIGILQPVQGVSSYRQINQDGYVIDMISQYKSYYPLLAQECLRHPDFLVDMKNIFDQETEPVFTDDCHLHPPFQQVVAYHIFNLITNRPGIKISDSMKCKQK
ncbi:MAG: hypothetical protein NZM35_00485 [Chitinophagales bacterium]|nr:hypothetical protein [Chitinophagales bacterium]MDW8417794.1 hypothetical protein [Chitinophagales bacterium]